MSKKEMTVPKPEKGKNADSTGPEERPEDEVDEAVAHRIYFDGHTLELSREKTFNRSGNIFSDTKSSEWKD
jgi:hypothetical protein